MGTGVWSELMACMAVVLELPSCLLKEKVVGFVGITYWLLLVQQHLERCYVRLEEL